MGKILKLPVNTFNEFMKEKKINYQDYVLILLYSNHGGKENELDVEDNHRYLYREKFIANKEEIESLSNRKIDTITRNINKIVKLSDSKMVGVYKTTEGKLVYTIPKGNKYVLIEQDMLKILILLKSNAIKTYLFLKWKLREGKDKVTRAEILNNIGLGIHENNLQEVTNILKILVSMGLIKKENYIEVSEDGNEFNSKMILEITPYKEWKKYWEEVGRGIER